MSDEHKSSRKKNMTDNKNTSNQRGSNNTTSKKRKKKKKKKSLFLKVGISILFILLLCIAAVGTVFIRSLDSMQKVELDSSNLGIADSDELVKYDQFTKIKNIILFGVDSEEGNDSGRSDAMLLLTIDPIHNKIKVTSFMRDCRVFIPSYNYKDKLTHAYAYGGPELAIRTLNENFGLNIDDFVTVDFSTLPKVIDLIGGVDIDVTEDDLETTNNVITSSNYELKKDVQLINNAGIQTLTGGQVLAYARNRSSNSGDFDRTERQRKVLDALFKSALSTSITKYPSILNTIMPYITTSMSTKDILSTAYNVVNIGGGNLEQSRFPTDANSWGDYAEDPFGTELWYLFFDEDETKKEVQDYIFDDKSPDEFSN